MLDQDQALLVVVDVQGKLAQLMADKEHLFDSLKTAIKGFQLLEVPILWLEQVPDKLGPTIAEVAELLSGSQPIAKTSFGCMGSEEFRQELETSGRKQIVLAGIEAHICVYQSAIQLIEAGYEVTVLEDAVSSRTLDNCQIGLDRMAQAGVAISCVEMSLFELQRVAEGEKFKALASLVK
ncbi:MAG: hydrolase [Gammaproteobacteria bacterium]|nr:MAG: hydrolase [Pseudomonadota bacterium]PIE38326.1 MAG: hydrolase [Gammaproteobacteria bacterium]